MPVEKFETASGAIAASATSNVMNGRKTAMKPYDRVVQGICVIERDNTPVIGEETWILYFGDTQVATGRSILAATAGSEYVFPDNFDIIGMTCPGGYVVTLDVTNTDGAAAHGAGVAIAWDRF